MASSVSFSSKERNNFTRLSRLLVDCGTRVLRDVFDSIHPPKNLHAVLHNKITYKTLQGLRSKRIVNTQQWQKLYPATPKNATSSDFDITLLFLLLRNISSLSPPPTGWDCLPAPSDVSQVADLIRIKYYRNNLFAHIVDTSIDDVVFENNWAEIENCLLRLGGTVSAEDIHRLKVEAIDAEAESFYNNLLRDWEASERTFISNYHITVSGYDQVAVGPHSSITNVQRQTNQEGVNKESFEKERCNLLKVSIKRQTEFQHKLMPSHMVASVKTDDIFTNLVIQHGRKPLGKDDLNNSRREQLNWYSKVHGVPLERCEDLFTGEHESPPHYILVIGKPGIGKSIFCEKISRDWACDRFFQGTQSNNPVPAFSFVYLLAFRQLNSLANELLNLKDILNRCPLLDEKSTIDDDLFSFFMAHPEALLIIVDGFDEFGCREQIVSDYEAQFPNDPKSKMPVAAMCSKLLKGKMMSGITLLITSRPAEADEMGDLYFDQYVEIAGFSPSQVKEYIEKYFKNEQEIRKTILDHIMTNETLVSFAHIPILCRLMCWYMDWHVRNKTIADLPVTITDLFTDVILIFLQKHHSELKHSTCVKQTVTDSLLRFFRRPVGDRMNGSDLSTTSSARWKNTLEKLSVLAATLLLGKRLAFTVEDMRNTGLRDNEIENLKASGLLHCGPAFRDSAFEVTQSFCFTHLTVQEFLTANWFYKERRMPAKAMATGMVVQFMAGLAARSNDDKFLKLLVKWIQKLTHLRRDEKLLLTTKCLYEFKDLAVAKAIVATEYSRYSIEGSVVFLAISDVDCAIISFFLDILTSLNVNENMTNSLTSLKPQKPLAINQVYMGMCLISPFGLQRICASLMHESSPITEMILFECGIKDSCAQCIADLILNSHISILGLGVNKLTDIGFDIIHNALIHEKCQLKRLYLAYNEITDKSVEQLGESLITGGCRLKYIKVNNNDNVTENCRELVKQRMKEHCPDVEFFV